MTTLLEFLKRSSDASEARRKKETEAFQKSERIALGLSESDYQKYLETQAEKDAIAYKLEQEEIKLAKSIKEEERRLKEEKKALFAKSLGFTDESFHLATIVSIRHVNEFSGGTRRNNRVHVITKDRSLLCKQKRAGSSALSSEWCDNIELIVKNITCPKCLKKTISKNTNSINSKNNFKKK